MFFSVFKNKSKTRSSFADSARSIHPDSLDDTVIVLLSAGMMAFPEAGSGKYGF